MRPMQTTISPHRHRLTATGSGRGPHPEASVVLAFIARWLGGAIQPQPRPRRTPHLRDIVTIRQHLGGTIADGVTTVPALRLRRQIEQARSPQELWLLRNDAFQIIAQRHSQHVAAERIDALRQLFEDWLDPKQLARIR